MRRPWALLAALLGAAVLVDLGTFHRLEQADSILPVLVSLQRWTFFYWGQERYGMLVPLLALPVRHPLGNLLLQRGLLVLAGLAAVVLLARHTLRGRDWSLAGAISAATLLLLAPAGWRFEYLGDQPYGLSLALALGGLALAEPPPGGARRSPGRVAAGLVLVLLAHWVNAATGIVLLLLALARAGEDRLAGEPAAAVRARLGVDAALLLLGLLGGQGAIRLDQALGGEPDALRQALAPTGTWPHAWGRLASRAWLESGWWWLGLSVAAAAGLLALSRPTLGAARRDALLRAGSLAAAALAYGAFLGTLAWVAENDFHPRYLAPAALLLHLAAWSLLAEPLARSARLARPLLRAAALALPLAALLAYGPPSPARVRADLDALAGRYTEDVLAAGCQVVVGDYWAVWPAVWHALLTAHERGLTRPIHGLAHRAGPTVGAWLHQEPAPRLCRPRGDAAGWPTLTPYWMQRYQAWPVRVVEERATVDVLVLAPPEP